MDYIPQLLPSIGLEAADVRLVTGNSSGLTYYNHTGDFIYAYPLTTPTVILSNMADLTFAMKEYFYPRTRHLRIQEILILITDVYVTDEDNDFARLLKEANNLRKRGVIIASALVARASINMELMRRITGNEGHRYVYRSFSYLINDLNNILRGICSGHVFVMQSMTGNCRAMRHGSTQLNCSTKFSTRWSALMLRIISDRRIRVVPSFGPQAGGTRITLTGDDVQGVSSISVAGLPCLINHDVRYTLPIWTI